MIAPSSRIARLVYANSLPRDRLLILLKQLDIVPSELVDSADAGWNARLSAYWSARNRFIEVGRDVAPTTDVEQMLAQVREGLLGVLQLSPDFRPASEPLLKMAAALNERNPAAARALLAELARVQPMITASK